MTRHTTGINPTAAISAACVAAISAPALAGPVSFDFEGTVGGRNVSIVTEGGISGNVFAGGIKHLVDGELAITYCIDPEQWAQTGTTTFEQQALARGIRPRAGWSAKAAAIAQVADGIGESLWTTSVDRDVAAAFQLTVWEILKDYNANTGAAGLNFAEGDFTASGDASVISRAEGLFASIGANARSVGGGYVAFTHDNHQDMMGKSVPSPASLALAGITLPLFARRRRG